MDADSWDQRYRGSELVWGIEANRFVVATLAGERAGTALDAACGEGRNALWLAQQGWQVTGVDFSPVAVHRAGELAERAGLADQARFVVGDVVTGPLPAGPFDAVLVAYLQLPATPRREALRGLAAVVAPGGLLLVVGHDSANLEHGTGGPQDPALLFSPAELRADLAGTGLSVERAEQPRRPVATDAGPREAIDALVLARRPGH